MANKIPEKAKSFKEILQSECILRRFRDVKLEVFNHGIHFETTKICLYSREATKKYIIVLEGNEGYLVNTEFEAHHGESEFLYLCLQDEARKRNEPVLLNFFTYVFYDKNMEEVIDQ